MISGTLLPSRSAHSPVVLTLRRPSTSQKTGGALNFQGVIRFPIGNRSIPSPGHQLSIGASCGKTCSALQDRLKAVDKHIISSGAVDMTSSISGGYRAKFARHVQC